MVFVVWLCFVFLCIDSSFSGSWLETQELRDRIAKAKDSNKDLSEVGRKLVDLHGEMVLLEIYSVLNYTGTYLRPNSFKGAMFISL